MTKELSGRRIVVPETRELGQLVRMLEELGADTLPCPMIAIRDAPDPRPVKSRSRCQPQIANRRFACMESVLVEATGKPLPWLGIPAAKMSLVAN